MTDWDKPTLTELQHDEWLDEVCEECGEKRGDCTCPPGCSCDSDDADED